VLKEKGIVEELLAELDKTQNQVRELQEARRVKLSFVSPFRVENTKPLEITGIALAEGVWNGVYYPFEELEKGKISKKLPIRIEHGKSDKYKNREVGEITNLIPNEVLKALIFKGKITDPEAISDIKEGKFKEVSLATWMNYKPIDGKIMGIDYDFEEMSLTVEPACPSCVITHAEQLTGIERNVPT